MGKDSGIEWTDHTFNPWWGCEKVSPACDRCYAESFSKRYGHELWGKDAPRRFFGDKHWNQPINWNVAAKKAGVDAKVFCASMADVFEDRPDLDAQRERLSNLIRVTTNLEWLLLTKRPENFARMLSTDFRLPNVWLGITAENQRRLDERMEYLAATKACIKWVSYEPALGEIDISRWQGSIDWIIIGGESGAGARAMPHKWARKLLNQCREFGIAYFMKQLGGFPDKRHDINEFPEDLRVRDFPVYKTA